MAIWPGPADLLKYTVAFLGIFIIILFIIVRSEWAPEGLQSSSTDSLPDTPAGWNALTASDHLGEKFEKEEWICLRTTKN